jgi:hypothetical protein
MHAQTLPELSVFRAGEPINDGSAWTARDFPDDRSWVHELTNTMRGELLDAARQAQANGIAPQDLTPSDFRLNHCLPLLRAMHAAIDSQPGFVLLSGFPVEGISDALVRLAYCGFCAYFGDITVQNRDQETILEVTDKGKAYDINSRGYHSTAHLDFHNDGTNIVTLLCVETAASGGESMLVSGPTIYNTILKERPEHLEALYRGFHHHRRDQKDPQDAPVTPYRTPVFGAFNDLFHLAYAGPSIRYCEAEGIELTSAEKAALDFFVEVAERPQLQVSMEMQQGDLQFVNNFLLLHARNAYQDSATQRRKLLRLWLDDKSSQRLGPGKMDWYMPAVSRFTLSGGLAGLEHA